MSEKESRRFLNTNKMTRAVIKSIAAVAVVPTIVMGSGDIPNVDNGDTILQPESHHQIYDDKTLVQKYAQIVWEPKHVSKQQILARVSSASEFSPDQLSVGTKVAIALGLLSLLATSVARASEFAKYANSHEKYLAWTGVSLLAAANIAYIAEAFR